MTSLWHTYTLYTLSEIYKECGIICKFFRTTRLLRDAYTSYTLSVSPQEFYMCIFLGVTSLWDIYILYTFSETFQQS